MPIRNQVSISSEVSPVLVLNTIICYAKATRWVICVVLNSTSSISNYSLFHLSCFFLLSHKLVPCFSYLILESCINILILLLLQLQYTPQHLVRLLQIIVDGNCDMAVRQVASIHFKNFVAKNWCPIDPGMWRSLAVHHFLCFSLTYTFFSFSRRKAKNTRNWQVHGPWEYIGLCHTAPSTAKVYNFLTMHPSLMNSISFWSLVTLC